MNLWSFDLDFMILRYLEDCSFSFLNCNKKNEEENKIYDPLSIDYIVKKNDNMVIKNILFTDNNVNKIRVVEVQDKIYDPLSS